MQRKRQSDSTHAEVLSSGFPLRPPTGLPYFHFTLNSLKSVIFCNFNNPPHVCLCLSPPQKRYSDGCVLFWRLCTCGSSKPLYCGIELKIISFAASPQKPRKKESFRWKWGFFKRQQQMYRIRKYVFPSDIRKKGDVNLLHDVRSSMTACRN